VILVDSSVWIDYFRGSKTPHTDQLDLLLGTEPVVTGDLVLAEVLQGFTSDQDFNQGRRLLMSLPIVELVGREAAVQAAKNFRTLRARGASRQMTTAGHGRANLGADAVSWHWTRQTPRKRSLLGKCAFGWRGHPWRKNRDPVL